MNIIIQKKCNENVKRKILKKIMKKLKRGFGLGLSQP